MKKVLAATLTLAMIFGFSAVAPAQVVDVGAKLGFSIPTGDIGDDFDGGFAYGIYGEYLITPMFGAQLAFVRHGHDLSDPVDGLGGDVTFNELTLNGVINFLPGEVFEPYATAGLGVYFTIGEVDAPGFGVFSEDSTDLGINGGGGVTYMVTENVSVGGELVYHYIFGDIDGGYFNLLATGAYRFSTDY